MLAQLGTHRRANLHAALLLLGCGGAHGSEIDASLAADAATSSDAGEVYDAASDADVDGSDAALTDAAPPVPGFFARVVDGEIVLDIPDDQPRYWNGSCSDEVRLEQWNGSDWTPHVDDRPRAPHRGYYLDDHYIPIDASEGCDIIVCGPLTDGLVVAPAVEYRQNGTRPAPDDSEMHGLEPDDPAPVIESRPLSGRFRVVVLYSLDERCSADDRHTALAELILE